MSAVQQARAAEKELEQGVAVLHRIRGQIQAAVQAMGGVKEHVHKTRTALAAATQSVSGGTGTGQQLQVRAGASTVHLDALITQASQLIANLEKATTQMNSTRQDVASWASTLSR